MNRFPATLCATSVAFLWSLVLLFQMVFSDLQVTLLFYYGSAVFGTISLVGCYLAIQELKGRSRYWYMAIPLLCVLAGGALSAMGYVVTDLASKMNLLDPMTSGIFIGCGLLLLLIIGPCLFFFMISLFPLITNPVLKWSSLILSVFCLYFVLLIIEGILISFQLTPSPFLSGGGSSEWRHVFYSVAGLPLMGALLNIIAWHIRNESLPQQDSSKTGASS